MIYRTRHVVNIGDDFPGRELAQNLLKKRPCGLYPYVLNQGATQFGKFLIKMRGAFFETYLKQSLKHRSFQS